MCFQCTLRKISCFGSRISYPSQKSKASCQDALSADGKMDGDGKCSLVKDNDQVKITDL